MGRLSGKVALITGAARGQGAAMARGYVAEGARVVLADISDEAGKKLADELGDAASYQHLDVSSEDEWQDAVRHTTGQFGRLDVLVNNAGILRFSAIADTTLAEYEQIIRVNSVHPGMIDTHMVRDVAGGGDVDLSPAGEMVPLRRIGQPEDIAGLAVFLGSDESAYCTGAEFVADGGVTATHAFYRPS